MSRRHSRYFAHVCSFLIPAAMASAQEANMPPAPPAADAGFPFVMPWDDATPTITDCSALNPAPITGAQRVVAKNGHFYDAMGRRVRFLGTNFTFATSFMPHDMADKVAARLHKLGINIVRLHHMDTVRSPHGVLATGDSSMTLDPAQLDHLDYLIAALKQHGVYVDLNLFVGHRYAEADGVADPDNMPKGATYFDPRIIELEKQYAHDFLTHLNPYTGLTYATDPDVALLEINNEDSIVSGRIGTEAAGWPAHYRDELTGDWNAYLAAKYPSTQAMLAAWNAGATPYGDNMIGNGQFADGSRGWRLETNAAEGATQTVEPAPAPDPAGVAPTGPQGDVLHLAVSGQVPRLPPVQTSMAGLTIQNGAPYRVRFWAKSSVDGRKINVNVRLSGAPWSSVGLTETVPLGKDWAPYSLTFNGSADAPGTARLCFTLDEGDPADIWIGDISLQNGNAIELPPGQSLEAKNLSLLPPNDGPAGTDQISFLMDLESKYSGGMRDYIKGTLGTRAQVTCSQASYGGLAGELRESRSDYVDMHAYWQHPGFPHKPWSSVDWNIPNTPMLRNTEGGTLSNLGSSRLEGMPFTVSEYNEPAPNDFASEAVPEIAAYAAWQDWDGFFLFDYASDAEVLKTDKINGWFATGTDPNKLAYLPAAATLFLGGNMATAASTTTLLVPRDGIPTSTAKQGGYMPAIWSKAGLNGGQMLGSRTLVRLTDGTGFPTLQPGADDPNPAFQWADSDPATATISAYSPTARFLVGYPGPSWQGFHGLDVTPDAPGGFLSLALVSRDGKALPDSNSLLLTAATRFENQDDVWNTARTSVGNQWGHGPVLAHLAPAEITVATGATAASVYALDATGARVNPVPSTLANGKLRFHIGPDAGTVWYEISTSR